MKSPDNNVNEICYEFVSRSQHGFKKYGTTTERTDLDFDQWLQHLKEELMDAVVYVHRVQKEREQTISHCGQDANQDPLLLANT